MKTILEPMLFVKGWRFLQAGVLFHLWILEGSRVSSFIMILLLLVMISLRWRYRMPVWSVGLDVMICFLYFPITDISYYGLVLPIFELAFRGKWYFSFLLFASLFFTPSASSFLFWYYFQGFFFGTFSWIALKNQQKYILEADEQRQARYELERIKLDLLEANKKASHHAELLERYRISRELHDHLGHDLTGASLALQAYEYVKNPEEANQLLQEVRNRLERSTIHLRDTVHNMTPTMLIGVDSFENIVDQFQQLNIEFHKSGDMLRVPAHIWGWLEACLKEALTNVARHSNATKVEIDLQATDSIVRLLIGDNGTVQTNNSTGSGLRGLQMRARSLGGSLSVSRDNGFLLVGVIPLNKEG